MGSDTHAAFAEMSRLVVADLSPSDTPNVQYTFRTLGGYDVSTTIRSRTSVTVNVLASKGSTRQSFLSTSPGKSGAQTAEWLIEVAALSAAAVLAGLSANVLPAEGDLLTDLKDRSGTARAYRVTMVDRQCDDTMWKITVDGARSG